MSLAASLQGLTGPFIVGTALSTFLLGVTLTQCYTYFANFKTDRAAYRWAVWILLLIDISHTVCCQITLWIWFVAHYGEPASIIRAPWSFAVDPVMCGIVAFVVQLFYAHRIYLLGERSMIIPSLVVFGSLFQLAWSAGATAQVFVIQYFANFQIWTYGVACWLGMAAAIDMLITASLVWLLSRSKSCVRKTNTIVDRLIYLTIETNGLTFTVALLDLILFSCLKDASHVGPNLCLIKLYFNSFLVSLNSRTGLSEDLGGSRTMHSTLFKNKRDTFKSAPESVTLPVNGQPSVNSLKSNDTKAVYEKTDGVHVYTTASLSAGHVSDKTDAEAFGSQTKHLGIGPMRADKNNGFTTDIVGGAHTHEDEKRISGMA